MPEASLSTTLRDMGGNEEAVGEFPDHARAGQMQTRHGGPCRVCISGRGAVASDEEERLLQHVAGIEAELDVELAALHDLLQIPIDELE